jgi:hypothetical protein
MFPIRYSPILVADADTLFDDALKVHQDIHPIFLGADRSFKAEYMKPTTGKNVFLEGTNPFPQTEQTPEQNPFTPPEKAPEPNPFTQPAVVEPVAPPATDPGAGTGLFTKEQSQPLEIPPELQVKLDAAREKFETLKTKIADEEEKLGSPFAKTDSKQKRKAVETREKNKLLAARNAADEKAALESKRTNANQARDERARKRAGIVPTAVESLLETTETSTNEAAESLKALEKEQPTSASQNWFMDAENELQMYFDYYNQVERDLADVPPVVPATPPPPPSDTLALADKAIAEGREGLRRSAAKREEAAARLNAIKTPFNGGTPKKHKHKKTRKLTFRRSRKQ